MTTPKNRTADPPPSSDPIREWLEKVEPMVKVNVPERGPAFVDMAALAQYRIALALERACDLLAEQNKLYREGLEASVAGKR
jgi:hypothetical protein